LRTNESETEILLGNKQLLGIFFVVAILLGMAFTGGYMVGRGSLDRVADTSATSARSGTAAETRALPADSSGNDGSTAPETASAPQNTSPTDAKGPQTERPLGSRPTRSPASAAVSTAGDDFRPGRGQTFLQVAAVGRDEAEAIADVLHKKGFRAHAVPKPGNPKFYRVLIGPIKDTADLSSTRDSLRKTGFREVIVQKYQ
jgi:cell division septation protein DedD